MYKGEKTQRGGISIYHNCLSGDLAFKANTLFKKYRDQGQDRDGVTGSGKNKEVKDSRDMNPIQQYPVGHEFRVVAEEIERKVAECIVDYYKDNPNMLYSAGDFGLNSYQNLPSPETVLADYYSIQHGQFQYYAPQESNPYGIKGKGGGYPSNHSETFAGDDQRSRFRVLTWMLTLNELPVTKNQEGYTVFTGQKIAVRPKAGQLVLFSPWVDCEHRGNRVGSVDKSIVTSWVTTNRREAY